MTKEGRFLLKMQKREKALNKQFDDTIDEDLETGRLFDDSLKNRKLRFNPELMTDKQIKKHKRASKVKKGKQYFKMILSVAY